MNLLKILLSVVLLSMMVMSCGSDDNSCTADDWVGTWSGDADCSDGTVEATTITITKVNDTTISLSDGADTFEIMVEGCSFRISETLDIGLGPISVDINGEVDGSMMTYIVEAELLGQSVRCNASLQEQ